MEEEEKSTKKMQEKVKEETEKIICQIVDNGMQLENIELLGQLVDIHKDIANEEYWKKKEEVYQMRDYREYDDKYDTYGRRSRDSRGRYSARYGNDSERMMEEMQEHFGRYSEGREYGRRGNYRAKEDSVKSLDYMLQSVVEFIAMLENEAESPEEIELIKKYSRKISEM